GLAAAPLSAFSAIAIASSAPAEKTLWWEPGSGERMAEYAVYANPAGNVGILNAGGPIGTEGHPFFDPLGANGRACVSCHQPADGMSLSLRSIRQQWNVTGGKDPIFAMIDGANCPNLPPGDPA